MSTKQRPNVDDQVFMFAEGWLNNDRRWVALSQGERDDLVWDLADTVQKAVEAFDAEKFGA